MITKEVTDIVSFYGGLERARRKCLHESSWTPPPRITRLTDEEQQEYRSTDPALLALDAIAMGAVSVRQKSRPRSGDSIKVTMRKVHTPPRYDAWVPVRLNYWVGKDLHVEPYMPFLGDQDHDCELAFEVFEDMADDAGKRIDLSDGEVNSDGTIHLPRNDIDRVHYYSMPQAQWRAATRKAILAVLDQFKVYDETMWKILATALGINDIRRIKAVARVARERRADSVARSRRRKAQRAYNQALCELHDNPEDDSMPMDESWNASANPGKYFCLVCHIFQCPQHDFNVDPIIPIEDEASSEREKLLQTGNAKICSKHCFLRDSASGKETEKWSQTDNEWSAEEILLLRESVPIFGLDPCSLAVVVGSRSCREVAKKLEDPLERDIALDEIRKAQKPNRVEVKGQKKQLEDQDKKDLKKQAKTPAQSREATTIDQDYTPCYHNGPCNADNCSCVKLEMYCEPTCGCRCGQFTQNEETRTVVWTPPSQKSSRKPTPRRCKNRHYGCNCEKGNCNSPKCPCWDQNRACNPDLCGCDVTVLPQHTSTRRRRCRNVPTSIGAHKKTMIGKSDVHGFGLFAGERFETGDLVGVYSGQIIDTRLADMIGRLYDATDRTYIFNVTESLVIDGGLLGSKAKFVNHTRPGAKENCASRLVRVRGDAYVALFCKRPVDPGEEFLFDYRFTGEIPSWAKEDRSKSR